MYDNVNIYNNYGASDYEPHKSVPQTREGRNNPFFPPYPLSFSFVVALLERIEMVGGRRMGGEGVLQLDDVARLSPSVFSVFLLSVISFFSQHGGARRNKNIWVKSCVYGRTKGLRKGLKWIGNGINLLQPCVTTASNVPRHLPHLPLPHPLGYLPRMSSRGMSPTRRPLW